MKEGIRMPGFTAETSLYKPRRHYDLMVNQGGDGQVVIPQRHIPANTDIGGGCWVAMCFDGPCVVCESRYII